MINKRLTILLTLKDRHLWTSRWMQYANEIKMPYRILIADGSIGNENKEILSEKDRYTNVHYEYLRYPSDNGFCSFYKKIKNALLKIDSPYVILADNDDFFFMNGISIAIEFLETYHDYSVCDAGLVTHFSVLSKNNPVYGESIFNHARLNKRPSIEQENIIDRFCFHFSHYDYTYYGVHHVKHLQQYYTLLVESEISDPFFAVLLIGFLSIIDGKIKRLEIPYLARQRNSPSSSKELNKLIGSMKYRMEFSDDCKRNFDKFLDCLAGYLSLKANIPLKQSEDYVVSAISVLYKIQKNPLLRKLEVYLLYLKFKLKLSLLSCKIKDFLTPEHNLRVKRDKHCTCEFCLFLHNFLLSHHTKT